MSVMAKDEASRSDTSISEESSSNLKCRPVVVTHISWWHGTLAVFVHDPTFVKVISKSLEKIPVLASRFSRKAIDSKHSLCSNQLEPTQSIVLAQLSLGGSEKWYRARVERIFSDGVDELVSVTLIDFGRFVENVPLDNLKSISILDSSSAKLPHAVARQVEGLNAGQCFLDNPSILDSPEVACFVANQIWNETMIDEGESTNSSRHIHSVLDSRTMAIVQLTSIHGENFNDILKLKLKVNFELSPPSEFACLLLDPPRLIEGEDVIISSIPVRTSPENDNCFSVQIARYPLCELARLEAELQNAAERHRLSPLPFTRSTARRPVAVEIDGGWKRGLVLSSMGPHGVKVFLADYGIKCEVPRRRLFDLPMHISDRLPAYGRLVELRHPVGTCNNRLSLKNITYKSQCGGLTVVADAVQKQCISEVRPQLVKTIPANKSGREDQIEQSVNVPKANEDKSCHEVPIEGGMNLKSSLSSSVHHLNGGKPQMSEGKVETIDQSLNESAVPQISSHFTKEDQRSSWNKLEAATNNSKSAYDQEVPRQLHAISPANVKVEIADRNTINVGDINQNDKNTKNNSTYQFILSKGRSDRGFSQRPNPSQNRGQFPSIQGDISKIVTNSNDEIHRMQKSPENSGNANSGQMSCRTMDNYQSRSSVQHNVRICDSSPFNVETQQQQQQQQQLRRDSCSDNAKMPSTISSTPPVIAPPSQSHVTSPVASSKVIPLSPPLRKTSPEEGALKGALVQDRKATKEFNEATTTTTTTNSTEITAASVVIVDKETCSSKSSKFTRNNGRIQSRESLFDRSSKNSTVDFVKRSLPLLRSHQNKEILQLEVVSTFSRSAAVVIWVERQKHIEKRLQDLKRCFILKTMNFVDLHLDMIVIVMSKEQAGPPSRAMITAIVKNHVDVRLIDYGGCLRVSQVYECPVDVAAYPAACCKLQLESSIESLQRNPLTAGRKLHVNCSLIEDNIIYGQDIS